MAYSTRKCASRRRKASRRKTYRRKARGGGRCNVGVDMTPKEIEYRYIVDLVNTGQIPVRSHI